MAMLGRVAPGAAGGDVIYSRGDNQVLLSVTFGRTEFEVETAGVVTVQTSDRDFIFPAAELILDGAIATPLRGDLVTVITEQGTVGDVFEVLAPGGATPYRKMDPEGTMLRVHGKLKQ